MKLATLVYVQNEDTQQTLMIHRCKKDSDYHLGKWNGLGGKFEAGETPEECAIREIKEEAGLTISNPILKGIITFPMFDDKDDWYVFLFTVNDWEGNLTECDEGELAWIDNKEILNLPLWEGDTIFIPWLYMDGLFSAKFVYKEGKYISYEVNFY